MNQKKNVNFAISAGFRNKHPNSETLSDIQESCNSKQIDYNIFSTNICYNCSNLLKLPSLKINIIENKLSTNAKILFLRCRSASYKDSNTSLGGLVGLQFKYNLNDGTVSIIKLLDDNIIQKNDCYFKNHEKTIYPYCQQLVNEPNS